MILSKLKRPAESKFHFWQAFYNYMEFSIFHTNARSPNCSVFLSMLCRISNNGSTRSSSTTVRMAEHMEGHAWLP